MKKAFKYIRRWVYAIFVAIDLFFSALTGGAPFQTISARLGRKDSPVAKFLCRWWDKIILVVFGAPNHCEVAIASFEARMAVSPTFEG